MHHTNNIYAEDNTTVHINIFDATLGTQYDIMIATLKSAGNGRGA